MLLGKAVGGGIESAPSRSKASVNFIQVDRHRLVGSTKQVVGSDGDSITEFAERSNNGGQFGTGHHGRIISVRRPGCNAVGSHSRKLCGSPKGLTVRSFTVAGLPSVRDDLRALEGYHSPQLDVEVKLNNNESPHPPPDGFTDALTARLTDLTWNRYPDRKSTALCESIARHEGVAPDEVFVANGSNEVIQTLCLAYAGFGRTVLTFEPTYAMHGQIARTVQSTVVEAGRDAAFGVDVGVLERAIGSHEPSIVFLCSPNNPTGTVEHPETVARALEISNGLVVVDEAYGQFASFSSVGQVREDVPLVVTRTFSKTWSMAGARLGYLIGPAEVIEELHKVVLPYHLDSFKQASGEVALEFVDEMEQRIAEIVSERARISASMTSIGLDVFASHANFVLFRTAPVGRAGDDVWQGLVDRSVLVRNCSSWPRLSDCLRVTIGTVAENDRFLDALTDTLKSVNSGSSQGAIDDRH